MKPILFYEKLKTLLSDMGDESSVPSISNMINVQNKTKSHLSEDDGLFISYGILPNSYPYKQRNTYTRDFEMGEIDVAVLENDLIKATFLTSLGGRLWSLIDKITGENLLYTNDVIRPSNLAAKNAWFSGGVEWNVGIIGHTPFTTEQMFVGELKTDDGDPVLRIYEFERIRKITYQMDFFLTEESKFLFCRMRICNDNDTLVPMYWWSNMAVPEFEGGRIIVPANEAFTSSRTGVYKVNTPVVNNIDVSMYCDIPQSIDYFFDIKYDEVKFIANVNCDGYGLIQASTSRLRGRKLFSWGHSGGSNRWQQYLTEQAGPYIEIQAGVEKTQYGCIPMPPNTAWEWIEIYGAIKTQRAFSDYAVAVEDVKQKLTQEVDFNSLENMLVKTKESIAKKPAKLMQKGSGYGALENMIRKQRGETPIAPHLDFSDCDLEQKQWLNLLEHGYFDDMDTKAPPQSFMADEYWFEPLKKSVECVNATNWYAQYQLGLMYLNKQLIEKAKECLNNSLLLKENCWSYHTLSIIAMEQGEYNQATYLAYKATRMIPTDLSLAKDCTKILLDCKQYDKLMQLIESYPYSVANDARIQMYKAFCLLEKGNVQLADEILNRNGGLVVPDIREGELSITDLWCEIEKIKNPSLEISEQDIPLQFNFRAN